MNMKMKGLLAALLIPAAAIAAEPPTFKSIDQDKDGYLSRDEITEGIPQVLTVFERVDANKDGKLDPKEYEMALRVLSGQTS
jgi:hypothetical protein